MDGRTDRQTERRTGAILNAAPQEKPHKRTRRSKTYVPGTVLAAMAASR